MRTTNKESKKNSIFDKDSKIELINEFIKNHKWLIVIIILFLLLHSTNIFYKHASFGDEPSLLRAAAKVREGNWLYIGANYRPLFNAFTSMAFIMFGNYEWAGYIVTLGFGLASLVLVYFITIHFFKSKSTALIATIFTGLTTYFAYYSRTVKAESVLLAFFLLIILLYLKTIKKFTWTKWIIVTGLACLILWVRQTGMFILAIILLHEAYLFLKKKQDRPLILKRAIFIFLCVIIFYGATHLTFKFFEPQAQSIAYFKTSGADIDEYNALAVYQIVDVFLKPIEGVNFVYYLIVMWNWCIPGLLILSVLGMILLLKTKKEKYIFLIVWFWFLYIFLSIFPQHRVKIFYPMMPAVTITAAYFLGRIKNNFVKIGLVGIFIIVGLITIYPVIITDSSSHYEASKFILDNQPDGFPQEYHKIVSSNLLSYWWYLEHYDGFDKHMKINKGDFTGLAEIENLSEFKELKEQGFKYIIIDEIRCFELINISEQLKQIKPIKTIPNEIVSNDPLIKNYFQQKRFMSKTDVERHLINTCNPESDYFKNILIYDIDDVIKFIDDNNIN